MRHDLDRIESIAAAILAAQPERTVKSAIGTAVELLDRVAAEFPDEHATRSRRRLTAALRAGEQQRAIDRIAAALERMAPDPSTSPPVSRVVR